MGGRRARRRAGPLTSDLNPPRRAAATSPADATSTDGTAAKYASLPGFKYSVSRSPARSTVPTAGYATPAPVKRSPGAPTRRGDRNTHTRSARSSAKNARASVGPGSTSRCVTLIRPISETTNRNPSRPSAPTGEPARPRRRVAALPPARQSRPPPSRTRSPAPHAPSAPGPSPPASAGPGPARPAAAAGTPPARAGQHRVVRQYRVHAHEHRIRARAYLVHHAPRRVVADPHAARRATPTTPSGSCAHFSVTYGRP